MVMKGRYKSLAVIALVSLLIFSMAINVYNDNYGEKATGNVTESSINPYVLYTSEPAPMGISAMGIGPRNTPYSLKTSSFEGIINITDIKTYNASLPSGEKNDASIQLNLHLNFSSGGHTYDYWIQNVAILSTSNKTPGVSILDNVWNQTTRYANIYGSTLSGNGTLYNSNGQQFYIDEPSMYITTDSIGLREVYKNISGYPTVYMEYNTGSGWNIYDTVKFIFAKNASNADFIVQGYRYTSKGNPCDAELILGGPGNGASTTDVKSNLTMQLKYWNGHNYQAIENAYNFGSDTAETISNANSQMAKNFPGVQISNGTGKLNMVYSQNDLSYLNITAKYIIQGYVLANNYKTNFRNYAMNITLIPGEYNISIYSSYGQKISNFSVKLAAKQTYYKATENVYPVIFKAIGLINGTLWFINMNKLNLSSTDNEIVFYEKNGTYNYNISGLFGYSIKNQTGTITVHGNFNYVNVSFHANPIIRSIEKYAFYYIIALALIAIILMGISGTGRKDSTKMFKEYNINNDDENNNSKR
ncbi:hypothetical protein TZ01_07520 [Acidiplasma sp. MBA-1]|jgi:thermopsin|nr:hypothetical protein TZ01_07520 [Acidiplasma sp. MBA-1]